MRKYTNSRLENQRGIVSIVITVILMVVITLIVLSFAKISRREQRSALDRQLSTQAFYAAETGINDARRALESWPDTDVRFSFDYLTTCDATNNLSFAHPSKGNIPQGTPLLGSGQAAYTCVFVDPSPNKLVYAKTEEQIVVPLRNNSGGALQTLEVYWDEGRSGGFTGCTAPASGNPINWPADCDAPILRIELVDADPTTPAPNDLSNSKVFFIWPSVNQTDPISYSDSSGTVVRAPCAPPPGPPRPNRCYVQITDMVGDRYYARISGIYKPIAATITANNGVAELVGAQTMIDATGRASDVERRVQVRVNLKDQFNKLPLFGVSATDKICKHFVIDGTGARDVSPPSCWANPTQPD